jgi:hypothetical protein
MRGMSRVLGTASLWLLGATAIAVVIGVVFQGDRTWAAVVPVIALALLQRFLRSRLRSRAIVDGEQRRRPRRSSAREVAGWLGRLP